MVLVGNADERKQAWSGRCDRSTRDSEPCLSNSGPSIVHSNECCSDLGRGEREPPHPAGDGEGCRARSTSAGAGSGFSCTRDLLALRLLMRRA